MFRTAAIRLSIAVSTAGCATDRRSLAASQKFYRKHNRVAGATELDALLSGMHRLRAGSECPNNHLQQLWFSA
jgi:hypothetical protein